MFICQVILRTNHNMTPSACLILCQYHPDFITVVQFEFSDTFTPPPPPRPVYINQLFLRDNRGGGLVFINKKKLIFIVIEF